MTTQPTPTPGERWARLPRERERLLGLTRPHLNSLILPSFNNGNPPVRSVLIIRPGKTRGVRLIDLDSLRAYLDQFDCNGRRVLTGGADSGTEVAS